MNPLKNWIVNVLATGLYQGNRGSTFWMAVSIRHIWGRGFDGA